MTRAQKIATEHIVDVARRIFLERGFDTPTSVIAREAGISEGLLYKRFATKNELFYAAMGVETRPAWILALASRVGQGDLASNLQQVVIEGIGFFREHLPKVMLMWSCKTAAADSPLCPGPRDMPRFILETLTQYVEGEIELGRIDAQSAEVAARILLGSIANYAFLQTLDVSVRAPLPAERYAEEVVRTLLLGILPERECS